jgi:hypothetical protein
LLIEIRQLGERTSLEQFRQQIREMLIRNGRKLPAQFTHVKLTNLPRVNATEVYWKEIQCAAAAMGFQLLNQEFFGADKPLLIRCQRGHTTSKTPRSILQGHRCDQWYMERLKNPVRLSDGRVFESGTAAARVLGVRKETVNKASLNGWKVKGLGIQRIARNEFRQSLILA